jgi:hypothetical protein
MTDDRTERKLDAAEAELEQRRRQAMVDAVRAGQPGTVHRTIIDVAVDTDGVPVSAGRPIEFGACLEDSAAPDHAAEN